MSVRDQVHEGAHMVGISSKLLGRELLINQIRQVNPLFLPFLIKLVFNNPVSICWRYSKVFSGESLCLELSPKEEKRQNADGGDHSSQRAWEYSMLLMWLSLMNMTLIMLKWDTYSWANNSLLSMVNGERKDWVFLGYSSSHPMQMIQCLTVQSLLWKKTNVLFREQGIWFK